MATTDAKPGFRLPWSADRGDAATTAETEAPSATAAQPTTDAPVEPTPDHEVDTPAMIDAPAPESAAPPEPASDPRPAAPTRRPNKLMADLTRAMQAAAEQARTDALARLSGDSKAFIEGIHATSASEATELRRRADDDVAAIREWSKAEIARIREETEERIGARKADLERQIDEHAAAIERRIERVQARVAAFEAEMADFFERLMAEEDPTRLAAMAESLPEPPAFDAGMDDEDAVATATAASETDTTSLAEPAEDVVSDAGSEPIADAETEAAPAATTDLASTGAAWPTSEPAAPPAEADLFSIAADDAQAAATGTPVAEADPRLAALGFDADFAAAEAEAASFGEGDALPDDDIPVIADDALAARLAGLVPDAAGADGTVTTRVVVVGLVSVASIAGFKRHLARVPGVESVGVSSGPDGEFVFAVARSQDLDLAAAVSALPGFAARVTGEQDGELHITARDPESEA